MKNFTKAGIAGAALLTPAFVFAATLGSVVDVISDLISAITPVVVGLALLAFFWGLALYLLNFSGEDKDKKKGRDLMLYGILVLFVIVSIWGLVNLLGSTFGIGSGGEAPVPGVQGI